MSIEAVGWALNAPLGGNEKIVLIGLANHAHPDGGEAYPSMDTLAKYAHCDRRTVQRNVKKLQDGGWIEPDGVGPKGQKKWRLVMDRGAADATPGSGGGDSPPVAPTPPGGGGTRATQTVLSNRTGGAVRASADKPDPRDSLPEDFPAELEGHARAVFRILRAVAADHPGARKVWPKAVGVVVMSHPRHPLVATARELQAWAVDPPRPIKDVVGTYRTFLKSARMLEAPEPLMDDGRGAVPPGNVQPIRGRGGRPAPPWRGALGRAIEGGAPGAVDG